MIESYEVDRLRELIESKKRYLKIASENSKKKIQSEILFLQNDLMPIMLRETTLFHNELAQYFEKSLSKVIDWKCDAMLLFLPLSNDLGEICKVGVINPKSQMVGDNPIESIDVAIDSLGVGRRKIQPLNIEL